MRMVYVKALAYQQFHMVVAYYPKPSAIPLILDHINAAIKPATQRRDLVPIFSFNGSHLWLMKERGQGQLAGSASRLKLWTELQSRFSGKTLKRPKLNMDRLYDSLSTASCNYVGIICCTVCLCLYGAI